MSNDNPEKNESLRSATLGDQGQRWKFLTGTTSFERPTPLFDHPLEITFRMLRGLRMVDETIVVHGGIENSEVAGKVKP